MFPQTTVCPLLFSFQDMDLSCSLTFLEQLVSALVVSILLSCLDLLAAVAKSRIVAEEKK